MSVFDRLHKKSNLTVAKAKVAKVAKVDSGNEAKQAEKSGTFATFATIAIADKESENFKKIDNQPDAEHWDIKATAEKLTNWRPADAWFLRRHVPDASIDEVWTAYWLSIGYVGTGIHQERAIRYATLDIQWFRENRNHQRKLFLDRSNWRPDAVGSFGGIPLRGWRDAHCTSFLHRMFRV